MKENILYICDYAAKYTGSYIASMLALTQKARKKYHVYFLFPDAARDHNWLPQLSEDPTDFFFCDFTPVSLERKCRELKKTLGGKNTIVHTHFVADFNLMAIKLHFPHIFCHYRMTVPPDHTFIKKLKREVRRVIYRNLVIICVSEGVRDHIFRYFPGISAEAVHNAVNFERMESCKAAPVQYGKPGQFSVLIHGSDFVRKGVDLAIRAVQSLNESNSGKYHLYVTSNFVEEAWAQIDALTESRDNVTVVPTVENIASLYNCMDLFVSPSREEAFGNAVVEAAYFDCQVAASDIPGQNTMKCVPGILWMASEDVEGMKAAILEAADRKEKGLTQQWKEKQRALVVEEFDMNCWAQRIMTIYEKYL